MLDIELIYIDANKSIIHHRLILAEGASVQDALLAAKLFDDKEISKLTYGIFSKKVDLNTLLKSGDRLEIYRPLNLDPMEKRRIKAKKKK